MSSATVKSSVLGNPVYPIMLLIGVSHLLNDTLQAVVPAMFPVLKSETGISFTQLGWLSFALNMVASVFQPIVGLISDRKPKPYALPIGMCLSLIGIAGLAFMHNYWMLLVSVIFLGMGSAIFHPEGSRVSFMAAGSKRGLSQSVYQVGGNTGQALAPLISAFVLVPFGQIGAAWFLIVASVGIFTLSKISVWYKKQLEIEKEARRKNPILSSLSKLTKKKIAYALVILMLIIFTNFFVFHLTDQYSLTIKNAQLFIFLFLAVGAVGTFFGGPIADKIGKKNVILLSVLVPLPFALYLPYTSLTLLPIFIIIIGFFIMLSFS
ncbi:MAG: MFS transporter, partial [Kurthia sp.]